MTENTHHDPAALDKLAEPFTVLPNDNPASDEKRQSLIDKPAFGQVFSDNMTHMTWTKGEGWSDRRVEPYAPLKMDPGASVLHYAQECFEGLKAYRHADGSTWLFRRMRTPSVSRTPPSVCTCLSCRLTTSSVPWPRWSSATPTGCRPAASTRCTCVRSCSLPSRSSRARPAGGRLLRDRLPVRPVLPGRRQAGEHLVEDKWFRTGPGGTGFAKCGGNYAASLLGEYKGVENGCEQVCFVDAATKTYLEELGGMNMMAVHKDGHVETPSLTGNILPGVTRRSLIQLLQDKGHDVVETMIALDQLLEDIKSGEVTEVFACGTAAIITPIGRFKSEKFDVTVADGGSGKLTCELRDELLGIQLGEVEDPHNWMWKVC